MTRAESIAVALVLALASTVLVPYALDLVGLGVMSLATVVVATAIALGILLFHKPSATSRGDVVVFAATVSVAVATLLWLARPQLLPPGGGPDLTHHLLLVDYIEQHGTLVRDSNAAASIGEMAYYTPGLHVLAVVTAFVFRIDPFFALYPVVAFTIALKFGVFALCLLRLTRDQQSRVLFTIAGVAAVFLLPVYTVGSVINDSFLAQAVAELFAVTMWWALIIWDHQPARWPMGVFALSGAATFLTWPIWIGPPVLALALLMLVRSDVDGKRRRADFTAGVVPVAIVAAVHVFGHTTGLALVATSGALSVPRMTELGWWLPVLAIAGLTVSTRTASGRPVLAFALALAAQAAALWFVARQRGASTPYMALKMMYLAVYPLVAAMVVAASHALRSRSLIATFAVVVVMAGARQIAVMPRPVPTVSRDLWTAGSWARKHVPADCVDYLVGNEYTAYWLHLAVLRNPRSAAKSTDNSTYETQASFARWLIDDRGPRYAIARMSVVPREISDRVQVLYRSGDAAVLSRPGECGAITRGE